MMKGHFCIVVACLLLTASAFAGPIDPQIDAAGIYFDQEATVYETVASPGSIVQAYLVMTNAAYDVTCVEFAVAFDGSYVLAQVESPFVHIFDFDDVPDDTYEYIICDGGTFHPAIEARTVFTLHILVVDEEPLKLTLEGMVPNSVIGSTEPCYLTYDDVIVPLNVSAGLDGGGNPRVCAVINGTGVVATDELSWDRVKSLYR